MSARGGTCIIGYFTKGARSRDPKRAWAIQGLAFQAVERLQIDTKEILLRGDLHNTTTVNGKNGLDPDGYHTTFSIRSKENIQNNTFISAHAYTSSKTDFNLTKATLAAKPLPLAAKGRRKKRIWPENLTKEEVFLVYPSTEPDSVQEGHATGSGGNARGRGGHAPSTGDHAIGHAPSTVPHTTKQGPGFLSALSSGLAPTPGSIITGANMKGKK